MCFLKKNWIFVVHQVKKKKRSCVSFFKNHLQHHLASCFEAENHILQKNSMVGRSHGFAQKAFFLLFVFFGSSSTKMAAATVIATRTILYSLLKVIFLKGGFTHSSKKVQKLFTNSRFNSKLVQPKVASTN